MRVFELQKELRKGSQKLSIVLIRGFKFNPFCSPDSSEAFCQKLIDCANYNETTLMIKIKVHRLYNAMYFVLLKSFFTG